MFFFFNLARLTPRLSAVSVDITVIHTLYMSLKSIVRNKWVYGQNDWSLVCVTRVCHFTIFKLIIRPKKLKIKYAWLNYSQ